MDPATPGLQPILVVPPGTTEVRDLAVYVYDPVGGRSFVNIGYLGGIDRGIAFGHIPGSNARGTVTSLVGTPAFAAHPGNTGYTSTAIFRAFAGPETQYIEIGAQTAAPIPASPDRPLFTVDLTMANAEEGDRFLFALCDIIAATGFGQGGIFTTSPGTFWDTGGDAVPDNTPTTFGLDADQPVPVPPAAFYVDFIDGVSGPAAIIVTSCYANCDGSTTPPVLNVNDFVCFQQRFAAGNAFANCDASTIAPVLNINDFVCFQQRFAAGCK
jgi:hypothetical protein